MKLSLGIVGLPNVGKSTLFHVLTKQKITIANYPFATIDPNVGVVPVADSRLAALSTMSKSAKTVPAVVEFYDIAGLVKGANQGEGLGNQFLSHIREVSAIVHVVRCFGDGDIVHVEGGVDPLRDVDIIETELVFKDLETVNKRLEKADADARGGNAEFVKTRDELRSIQSVLEKGTPLFASDEFHAVRGGIVRELGLLTGKPQLFLLNGSEDSVPDALREKITELRSESLVMDLSGNPDSSMLTRSAYALLHLISFFTTGEDETRAWTIEQGAKAPQAAGVIHTDFEHAFIRAEVVSFEKLVAAGSWSGARQKGFLRLEGKEYVVQDGDVMVIRHGA